MRATDRRRRITQRSSRETGAVLPPSSRGASHDTDAEHVRSDVRLRGPRRGYGRGAGIQARGQSGADDGGRTTASHSAALRGRHACGEVGRGRGDPGHRHSRAPQGPDHPCARDHPHATTIAGERQGHHRRLPADAPRTGQCAELPTQQRRRDLQRGRRYAGEPALPRRHPHAGAGERPPLRKFGRGSVARRRPELDSGSGGGAHRGAQGRRLGDLRFGCDRRRGQRHHPEDVQRNRGERAIWRRDGRGRCAHLRCAGDHRPVGPVRQLPLLGGLLRPGGLVAPRPTVECPSAYVGLHR